jgi:hypothetical protein
MRKRNIIGIFFLLCLAHAFSEEDDKKKVFVPTPEASMTVREFERIERPFKLYLRQRLPQHGKI